MENEVSSLMISPDHTGNKKGKQFNTSHFIFCILLKQGKRGLKAAFQNHSLSRERGLNQEAHCFRVPEIAKGTAGNRV